MTGARKGGAWLLHLLGATALGMSGCHEIFAHAPSASVDSAPDITALADVSVDAPVTDARAPDAPDVMETGPAADLGDAAPTRHGRTMAVSSPRATPRAGAGPATSSPAAPISPATRR